LAYHICNIALPERSTIARKFPGLNTDMLQKTRGIVLRSVKYGESSLVVTVFTADCGVQSYMVQGARSSKVKTNKTGLLQPSVILDLVVYHNPQKNLQRISDMQFGYLYTSVGENIVKNTVAIFAVELLLRLLPESGINSSLYEFAEDFFIVLDRCTHSVANYPLFFVLTCARILGYEPQGLYSDATPYINLEEGRFSPVASVHSFGLSNNDLLALNYLLQVDNYNTLSELHPLLTANTRSNLLDWVILFLQRHAQHIGKINSLQVLKAVLH
jgi:DNA repair protein RecO (recombination protein O)